MGEMNQAWLPGMMLGPAVNRPPETPKRLWNVSLETEIVVLAESHEAAVEAAKKAVRDRDITESEFYGRAEPMTYFPAGDDGTEIPFGDRDPAAPDRTVDEWIERGAAPAYTAALKRDRGDCQGRRERSGT